MKKGAWNFELLSKKAKIIDTCEYHGKRYVLFFDLEYPNMFILVNITDRWYIYIDDYLLTHIEIVDDSLFSFGGVSI